MSVRPENDTPVLMCGGAMQCGPTKHKFVRVVKSQYMPNAIRQVFVCTRCDAERDWGLVEGDRVRIRGGLQ